MNSESARPNNTVTATAIEQYINLLLQTAQGTRELARAMSGDENHIIPGFCVNWINGAIWSLVGLAWAAWHLSLIARTTWVAGAGFSSWMFRGIASGMRSLPRRHLRLPWINRSATPLRAPDLLPDVRNQMPVVGAVKHTKRAKRAKSAETSDKGQADFGADLRNQLDRAEVLRSTQRSGSQITEKDNPALQKQPKKKEGIIEEKTVEEEITEKNQAEPKGRHHRLGPEQQSKKDEGSPTAVDPEPIETPLAICEADKVIPKKDTENASQLLKLQRDSGLQTDSVISRTEDHNGDAVIGKRDPNSQPKEDALGSSEGLGERIEGEPLVEKPSHVSGSSNLQVSQNSVPDKPAGNK